MPLDPDLTEFTTASPVIASFDSNDLASGRGIQKFQCGEVSDSSTNTFTLSDSTFYL